MNMTSIPDVRPPRTRRHPNIASVVRKFFGVLLLWLFSAWTLVVLPLSVMASDDCDQGDTRTICSVAAQGAIGTISSTTVPIALVLGTWGICSRRKWAPAAWVTAVALLMGAWIAVREIAK